MLKEIKTIDDFKVAISDGLVLVDFWATWCGPCQMMSTRIENELVPTMPNLNIVKVNVDDAPELAAQFGVMSIPTLLCYKNGVNCGTFVGVTDCSTIRAAFN